MPSVGSMGKPAAMEASVRGRKIGIFTMPFATAASNSLLLAHPWVSYRESIRGGRATAAVVGKERLWNCIWCPLQARAHVDQVPLVDRLSLGTFGRYRESDGM